MSKIPHSFVRDDNGKIAPLYTTSNGLTFAPVLDRRNHQVRGFRPLQSLMSRWTLKGRAEGELLRALDERAPDASAAFREAAAARNVGAFSAALDDFGRALHRWKHVTIADGLHGAADDAIYHYTAPIVSLSQSWRARQIEPTLINHIPRIATGTVLDTWQYYEEVFEAGLPESSASHNPFTGDLQGASEERAPLLFHLKWQRMAAQIDGRERERHDAMRGREGAPDWDLYQTRIDSVSKAVWRSIARDVVFGDPSKKLRGLLEFAPGSVSGDDTGAGLLAVGPIAYTAANVAALDTLNEQVNRQYQQVDEDEDLAANTLILPPADLRYLAKEFLSAAQPDRQVLETFMEQNPAITQITSALELAPRASDEARLIALGMNAAEAQRVSGGIAVGGVQKACAMLVRDDPNQLAWIEGTPLQVLSDPAAHGQETTLVRASSGGARCFAKGVQATADPSAGDPTGAFRVFWRD